MCCIFRRESNLILTIIYTYSWVSMHPGIYIYARGPLCSKERSYKCIIILYMCSVQLIKLSWFVNTTKNTQRVSINTPCYVIDRVLLLCATTPVQGVQYKQCRNTISTPVQPLGITIIIVISVLVWRHDSYTVRCMLQCLVQKYGKPHRFSGMHWKYRKYITM